MSLLNLIKKPDFGLLLLRVGLGVMMIMHGIPKLTGGASTLTGIGKSMAVFGITFAPLFWGLMAALTETVGGFLFLIGFKMRAAALFLTGLMVVAFMMHFSQGGDFLKYAWPLEMGIVFLSMIFIGPGKYSADGS